MARGAAARFAADDLRTSHGSPYYDYFGALAGERDLGYYSYDLGSWHIVVLNSNIPRLGESPQERWLRADLAAHPDKCILAYWHHPRFSSSGQHGNDKSVAIFWDALYRAGAEVVLGGHDHTYERFAPQTPRGELDPQHGIRQFVVGTGGRGENRFGKIQPNSEARSSGVDGVLKLVLYPDGYSWEFVPVLGGEFRDSGTGTCH